MFHNDESDESSNSSDINLNEINFRVKQSLSWGYTNLQHQSLLLWSSMILQFVDDFVLHNCTTS